jgi:hypothetical protein
MGILGKKTNLVTGIVLVVSDIAGQILHTLNIEDHPKQTSHGRGVVHADCAKTRRLYNGGAYEDASATLIR